MRSIELCAVELVCKADHLGDSGHLLTVSTAKLCRLCPFQAPTVSSLAMMKCGRRSSSLQLDKLREIAMKGVDELEFERREEEPA